MPLSRRALLAAVPLICAMVASNSRAASGWDGTWTGLWGGVDETSIMIADSKVVAYSFRGARRAVETRSTGMERLIFGTEAFTIVLSRAGETTARARFLSQSMGIVEAELTRRVERQGPNQ